MKIEFDRHEAPVYKLYETETTTYSLVTLDFSHGFITLNTIDMESRYQGSKDVYINALHEYLKDKYKVSLLCIWEGDHLIATITKIGWGVRTSSPPCYIDDNQYFEENLLEAVKKVLIAWKLIT